MSPLTDWLERAAGNLGWADEQELDEAGGSEQGRGMPQGRRSRLVIRRVDPWSILKFSVLLYLSVYFVILVAGVVLWSAATAAGVRGKIESFIGELIAAQDFKFK